MLYEVDLEWVVIFEGNKGFIAFIIGAYSPHLLSAAGDQTSWFEMYHI